MPLSDGKFDKKFPLRLIQINAQARLCRHKGRMKSDFAIQDETGTPLCPSCTQPMQFARSVPRFAALPELRTYQCLTCRVSYTAAVTPNQDADVAWHAHAQGRSVS